MPLKVLYFDLGQVLLKFSHERMCRQMADVAEVPWQAVRDAIFSDEDCRAAQIEYETGLITTEDFLDHFCAATGTSPDRILLAAAVCDIFAPIEPMFALVRRLAQAGNRLAILSNTNPIQWNYIVDGRYPVISLGSAASAFAWAILSYEVKAMKPDAAIYRAAIERAGVNPGEVFFTDDRLENVEGALAVGMDAVLFTDCETLTDELRERDVAGV